MEANLSKPTESDLSSRLERWVEQSTGGRVHCLRVETGSGRIILHGYTGSYAVRQLALNAVLEALERVQPDEGIEVELDIEVLGAGGRTSMGALCHVK